MRVVDKHGVAWRLLVVGVRAAEAWLRHGEVGAGQSTGGALMVWLQCGPVRVVPPLVDGIRGAMAVEGHCEVRVPRRSCACDASPSGRRCTRGKGGAWRCRGGRAGGVEVGGHEGRWWGGH